MAPRVALGVTRFDDTGTPLSLRRLTRSSVDIASGVDWERFAAIDTRAPHRALPTREYAREAEKVPSRWLMPTLDALSGSKIGVVDWQKQTADVEAFVTVESFDVSTQTVDHRIGDSAASETE